MANDQPTQLKAIRDFWSWFTVNAEKLKALHADRKFSDVAKEVNQEIDKIEPQLAWEIGPGKNKSNLLTISAEGNSELRPLADLMIQMAPELKGWEFFSSRPSRPAPDIVRLPESGVAFDTSGWSFIPVEHPENGRLDLIIIDDQLARSSRDLALKAVSVYLDELLGEDTVETWIGRFETQSNTAVQKNEIYKILDLPDYLLWATHRNKNPLRKSND